MVGLQLPGTRVVGLSHEIDDGIPGGSLDRNVNTGELNINGNTTAKFSSTGTEPQVDLVGHIATQVGGVGNFGYDYAGLAIFSSPGLYTAAICTP